MKKYFHILLLQSWTVHIRKWITMVIMTNNMTIKNKNEENKLKLGKENNIRDNQMISPNSSTQSNAMD